MADIIGRKDSDSRVGRQDSITTSAARLPILTSDDGAFALSVSKSIYSARSVLTAAYKLSSRWPMLVDEDEGSSWVLHVLPGSRDLAAKALEVLLAELVDQALRDQLAREFGDLRTLIVAQAFSEGNLLNPDEDELDYRDDPKGIRQRR